MRPARETVAGSAVLEDFAQSGNGAVVLPWLAIARAPGRAFLPFARYRAEYQACERARRSVPAIGALKMLKCNCSEIVMARSYAPEMNAMLRYCCRTVR
jgi:hypothetical protein